MAMPSPLPYFDPEPSTPFLLVVVGDDFSIRTLERTPLTIGRKAEKDICIPDSRISRDHAQIVREGEDFYIEDQGSKLGTYVNGTRVTRQKLCRSDQVDFGPCEIAHITFYPLDKGKEQPENADAVSLLTQAASMQASGAAADLERLRLFVEAARKLNTTRVLDEILLTLIEATLRITHAERGFVFLRDRQGKLRLAAGRDGKGQALSEDSTISHSVLQKAVNSGSEFLVTDTSSSADLAAQMSIVAFDLRTVICIPLLRHVNSATEVSGALYLDARHASRDLTNISSDLLRTIAHEAAALVENAELVQEQEHVRRYEQELAISGKIQQRLMTVKIPDTAFARSRGYNLACKEIGGDFFDVVHSGESIACIVADVCGKGVSAALLASILQGMVYAQLKSAAPLVEIADVVNHFLCQRDLGEKYATLALARLDPHGTLELVNCGHVPPFLVLDGKVVRTLPQCLPVGLIGNAVYTSERFQLAPGDRIVIATDGITEAQNAVGDFFGDERLEQEISNERFDELFEDVKQFCGDTPLNDDCTVLELAYRPV